MIKIFKTNDQQGNVMSSVENQLFHKTREMALRQKQLEIKYKEALKKRLSPLKNVGNEVNKKF